MSTPAPTTPAPSKAAETSRNLAVDFRQYGILAALVVIILLFEVLTGGRLLLPGNVNNLIQQNSYVLILAIGMVMVIIAGHIDLSVGSVVAMVGAVAALAMSEWHLPWWIAVIISLLVGALVGAWQGFWVAFVGIPAFIATLAGQLLFRGLTLIFLHGGTIGGLPAEFVAIGAGWLPSWLGSIGTTDVLTMVLAIASCILLVFFLNRSRAGRKKLGLPIESAIPFWGKIIAAVVAILGIAWQLANYSGTPIILILLAALILGYNFLLNRSVFGRHIYAMGGNLFAAIMSGVKTKRVNFALFVNIGVLAALAGVVSTARAGSAVASAGKDYELDAIAAVFIGGAAVQGGVGTVTGAMIGGLVMGVLNMGLSILSVDAAWQMAIKGLVLLLAVAFDLINKRRGGR
ncbi:putative multiple sugar transport system permease protein [Propionicimonas paludicola]|uniref:Xylose transport system permease protein XylH n=1 Tax=Propionicimonas paludicola TaxID=185243 RepID=A0A2A9CQE5_9ACTN|nr:multiple monosaccharide ABC transporter permease [Propionicimonas paludicola]PFG15880.1 putative multiple sugar transport system permease protein [Propionicimonas paludicola]